MACSTCSSGSPNGCQNTGHCSTGGCNKLNSYDWLSTYDFEDPTGTDIVEISFKKGARKEFFRNHPHHPANIKDIVVVDTGSGYDIGELCLAGELVRLQMKKKRVKEAAVTFPILRVANDRDVERLNEYRSLEKHAMVRARAISASLGLDMKVCDVEYRGDGRKATFYYTAEGRVDFRELVRSYAKEFQVKIEMRQIGARQESSRIGGIGSCGRELCCSTWLTDFKTVNTHAARYQNLSINQAKLSGQCGRLKCCLNYELDTYMESVEEFPQDVDRLKFQGGTGSLIKIDIFKKLLYYSVEVDKGKNTVVALTIDRVNWIKSMNMKGQLVDQLQDPDDVVEEEKLDFASVTGEIELPDHKSKKRRNKNKPKGNQRPQDGQNRQGGQPGQPRPPREGGGSNEPRREGRPGDQRREGRNPEGRREGGRPNEPRREGRSNEPRREKRPPQQGGGENPPEGQQRPQQQGPRPPQQPRPPRPEGSPEQRSQEPRQPGEGGGQRRNKNRFRNKNRNRGPRPDGDSKPPSNNPPA